MEIQLILAIISFILGICILVFGILMLVSPKFKEKFVGVNSKTIAKAVKEELAAETKKCKDCGAEIPVDSEFCNKCGKQQ